MADTGHLGPVVLGWTEVAEFAVAVDVPTLDAVEAATASGDDQVAGAIEGEQVTHILAGSVFLDQLRLDTYCGDRTQGCTAPRRKLLEYECGANTHAATNWLIETDTAAAR